MKSLKLIACAAFLILASADLPAQTPIETQPVVKLVPNGTLATCIYQPTAQEKPFYERLPKDEVATGSMFDSYKIHGKAGKYVGWFGIVRGISADAGNGKELTLLLDQKYFDGMSDCHIMLVNYWGGGDFKVKMTGDAAAVPPLALVKIYGKIIEEKGKLPVIEAEYIRIWPWMTFTFTDLSGSGEPNKFWERYSSFVEGDRVYKPYPDEAYYRKMLGNPALFGLDFKTDAYYK